MNELAYDLWLSRVPGIGPRKTEKILAACGSARECFEMKEKELRRIYGLSEEDVQSILLSRREDPEKLQKELEEKEVHAVRRGERGYPESLAEIPDSPWILYYKGRLPEEKKPTVAIVGARQCSEYGRAMARTIARSLSEAGVTIVSGMAAGIDAAGHWGALDASGETYGVLGNGVDICYPRSSGPLYEKLLKQGGVLSEYFPGTKPCPRFFPLRNRIISALSDAVIVIEARIRSGSLITADYALEQGKEIYALPGRITDPLSGGTNRLIRQGAFAIVSVEELLRDLPVGSGKIAEKTEAQKNMLAKEEMVVYSCLDFVPKCLEELLEETALSLGVLSETLLTLRKKGLCEETFPNQYRRGY